MQEISNRLRRVDGRLERLLASGWRNAASEAADLAAEADSLAALGLAEVAARLRQVAAAGSAAEALSAIALASSACRLLRARLPVDTAHPEPVEGEPVEGEPVEAATKWAPLAEPRKRKPLSPDRLVPLARVALAEGEVWACVHLRGGWASQWVLLDPPEARPSEPAQPTAGLVTRLLRGKESAGSPEGSAPWLRRQVQGHLRWQARYPLGVAGEVQRCVLLEPTWPALPDPKDDFLAPFREALAAGKLEDGMPAHRGGGPLQARELDATEVDSYVWPDLTTAAAFRAAAQGRCWALAWVQGALIAPLALLLPGGRLRKPQVVHLVPGSLPETLPA